MSHSVLFVFLLVVAGLSAVYSHRANPCEKRIGRRPIKGGWGGKCFGNQTTLWPRPRCDAIIYDTTISGCDEHGDEACCVDCAKQTRVCDINYKGSFGSNVPCCPGTLQVMTVREGSECVCCKDCKRKAFCRRNHGVCITKDDPVHNEEWCLEIGPNGDGGRIKKRGCKGNGCWCCLPPKTVVTTTPSN